MSKTPSMVRDQLVEAGYSVAIADDIDPKLVKFENDTIIGFVLCFVDSEQLLQQWEMTSRKVLHSFAASLRSAEAKSWNTYLAFLADSPADYGESVALGSIEENLVGTRKIARAGISDANDVHAALLSLLPIQNAPQLEAVDMPSEIRLRTSELPSEFLKAFFSEISAPTLAQLLEIGR